MTEADEIIESFQIIKKYNKQPEIIVGDKEILIAIGMEGEISEEDLIRLDVLGFSYNTRTTQFTLIKYFM